MPFGSMTPTINKNKDGRLGRVKIDLSKTKLKPKSKT